MFYMIVWGTLSHQTKRPSRKIGAFSFVGGHQQQALDESANPIDNGNLMAYSIPLTIS
jgi:hypothetical protein